MGNRNGFYFDPLLMKFVIGFEEARDNFHYAYVTESADLIFYKSDSVYPTTLKPLSFDLGIEILLRAIQQRNEKSRNKAR